MVVEVLNCSFLLPSIEYTDLRVIISHKEFIRWALARANQMHIRREVSVIRGDDITPTGLEIEEVDLILATDDSDGLIVVNIQRNALPVIRLQSGVEWQTIGEIGERDAPERFLPGDDGNRDGMEAGLTEGENTIVDASGEIEFVKCRWRVRLKEKLINRIEPIKILPRGNSKHEISID